MSLRFRCVDCGALVTLPEQRETKKNYCPQCDARLPAEPIRSGGAGLVLGLVFGGVFLVVLFVVGLGAIGFFLLAAKPDVNNVNNPPVVAEGPAPIQGENPNPLPPVIPEPKVEPKAVFPPIDVKPKEMFPPPFIDKKENPFPAPPPPKPKLPPVELKLPPLPAIITIPPTKLTEPTEVTLPDKPERTVVGGAGRYLIQHYPKLRKLSIFDVSEGKIRKYIDLAENKVHFAAGMNKLLVYLPTSGMMQRYDLQTGERETMKQFAASNVTAFVMGHSSAGPLLVRSMANNRPFEANGGARLYDITSFNEIEVPFEAPPNQFPGQFGGGEPPRTRTVPVDGGEVYAGGNGRSFGNSGNRFGAATNFILFEGGKLVQRTNDRGGMYVQPSPDGKYVFTSGGRALNAQLQPTNDVLDLTGGPNRVAMGVTLLPAHHGPYYVQLGLPADLGAFREPPKDMTVKIYLYGLQQEITKITYPNPAALNRRNDGRPDINAIRGTANAPDLVHLVPHANMLVIVTPDSDKLRLIPVNPEKELEKSGIDFVVVTSSAPTTYKAGQLFRYTPKALSKAGKITWKLESGPQGMNVAGNGEITWNVPADHKQATSVILALKDGAGKETFHSFTLTPEGEAFIVPPAKDPIPMPPPRVIDDKKAPGIPPNPPRLPIKSTTATERLSYDFPDVASRAITAGDGRFLLLHFAKLRKVGVFDVNELKIVRFIDLAEDKPLLAAGMTKLLVYLPNAKLLQRYNLLTGEREAMKQQEIAEPKTMAMGSASAGPLLMATAQGGKLFDIKTLTEIEPPIEMKPDPFGRPQAQKPVLPFTTERIDVSANGRVFISNGGFQAGMLTIEGSEFKISNRIGESWMYAKPSHDGKYVFRGGAGAITSDGAKTADVVYSSNERGGNAAYFYLPADHGPFYFHLHFKNMFGGFDPREKKNPDQAISVYMYGLDTPVSRLLTIKELPDWGGIGPQGAESMHERFHLIPRAGLMLVMGSSFDRMSIIPVDPYKALDEVGTNFLLVTSTPPGTFTPGKEFRYPVRSRTKAGGVKYKLEHAPEGMKVDANGVISWTVPVGVDFNDTTVILSLKDAADKEAFHNFRLMKSDVFEEYVPDPQPEKVAPAPVIKDGARIPFKLPKAPALVDIVASTAVARTEVPVADKIDAIAPAGGGRYLVLHAKKAKKVHVFDVVSAKIEHIIHLEDEQTVVAAGMNQLFVYRNTPNTIEKYNLQTGNSEGRKVVPTQQVTEMVMGSGSAGPLFVRAGRQADLYDADTLQPMTLPKTDAGFPFETGPVWASADGLTFTNTANRPTGSVLRSAIITADGIKVHSVDDASEFVVPRGDGKAIYIAGRGGFDEKFELLKSNQTIAPFNRAAENNFQLRPAEQSDYFLAIHTGGQNQRFAGGITPPRNGVSVYNHDVYRGITAVPIAEMTEESLPIHAIPQSVHLIPHANVVVFVPPSRDRLLVYPAGLKDRLALKPLIPPKPLPPAEWKLPPIPATILKPTTLKEEKLFTLTRPAIQWNIGGGGRYFAASADNASVTSYDLLDAKTLATIKVEGRIDQIAMGQTKMVLLVEQNSERSLRRFDIVTGQLEKTVLLTEHVYGIQIGSGSEGPLVVRFTKGLGFYDLDSLRQMPVGKDNPLNELPAANGRMAVAGDGRTILLTGHPQGQATLPSIIRLKNNGPELKQHGASTGFQDIRVSSDGTHHYFAGYGIYSDDFKPANDVIETPKPLGESRNNTIYFPSIEGPYYCRVQLGEDPLRPKSGSEYGLIVYKYGVEQPSFPYKAMFGRTPPFLGRSGTSYAINGPFFLLPTAKMLVAMGSSSRTELRLIPLDLDKPADPAVPPPSKTVPYRLPDIPAAPTINTTTVNRELHFGITEEITGLRSAMGGRYLVLQTGKTKLSIVDLPTHRRAGVITTKKAILSYTAGASKIVVLQDGTPPELIRYDLTTGKLEESVPVPDQPISVTMGSHSEGPIWVAGTKGSALYDLQQLKPMTWNEPTEFLDLKPNPGMTTASNDGRTFFARTGDNPTVVRLTNLRPIVQKHGKIDHTYVALSADGRTICLGGQGFYDTTLRPLPDNVWTISPQATPVDTANFVPSAEGGYILHVHTGLRDQNPTFKNDPLYGVTIYKLGQAKPLGHVPDLWGQTTSEHIIFKKIGFPHALHYLPSANLLAVVANDRRHLRLIELNPDKIPATPNVDPMPMPKPKPKPPVLPIPTIEYRLAPLPEPLPITAPTKEITVTISTPAQLSPPVVRIAGGGRYVLIQRTTTKIDLFDLNELKVVRQIDLPVGTLGWVAGHSKLFVFDQPTSTLRRIDLTTGKQDGEKTFTFTAIPEAIGSATNGPLLVRVSNQYRLFDGDAMQPMTLNATDLPFTELVNRTTRAAPDGRTWATAMGMGGGIGRPPGPIGPMVPGITAGFQTSVFTTGPNGVQKANGPFPSMYALPSDDGKHLFAGPHGILDYQLKTVTDTVRSETPSPREPPIHFYLPANDGPFYLQYHLPLNMLMGGRPLPKSPDSEARGVTIYAYGQTKPLLNLPDVNVQSERMNPMEIPARLPELIHLVPRAKALIAVAADGSSIRVIPVDLETAMAKANVEVPWVTSIPPRTFTAGMELKYPLKTLSKAGGLKYWLDQSFAGMDITADGILTWKVPADAPGEVRVTIRVKYAKGAESLHSFVLTKK